VPAPTADEAQALEDAATTLDILAVNTITSRVRFAEDNEEDLDLIHWEVGRTQSSKSKAVNAPAYFGNLYSLPPPIETNEWWPPNSAEEPAKWIFVELNQNETSQRAVDFALELQLC
jgi:hypothetical protein